MAVWMLAAFTNRKFLVLLHFPKVLFITLHSRFMKVGSNSTATVYLGRVLAFPGGVPALSTFQKWGSREGTQQPQEGSRAPDSVRSVRKSFRAGDVDENSGLWGPGVLESDSGSTARAWLWRDAISLHVPLVGSRFQSCLRWPWRSHTAEHQALIQPATNQND